MNRYEIQSQIEEVAGRVGIQIDWNRDQDSGPCYRGDGVISGYSLGGTDESWSNVVHEIAHWMVAPPTRRRLQNFGLGFTFGGVRKPVLLPEGRLREEGLASALGIMIEKRLGLNWKASFRAHNWHEHPGSFEKFAAILRTRGFASGRANRPTYKIRAPGRAFRAESPKSN